MRWNPELPVSESEGRGQWLEWLVRSFEKIKDWSAGVQTRAEVKIADYDATANTVSGSVYNGLALPAAGTVNLGNHFVISVAGTLNTPNAPEINGLAVVVGDRLVAEGIVYEKV